LVEGPESRDRRNVLTEASWEPDAYCMPVNILRS